MKITREQIIKLRSDLELSAERFGSLLDVSRQSVINWEREEKPVTPHHSFAKKMLNMIKVQKQREG